LDWVEATRLNTPWLTGDIGFTVASTQLTVVVTVAAKSQVGWLEPAAKSNETGEIVIVGFHVVLPNLQTQV
jgi:hypothetical protein